MHSGSELSVIHTHHRLCKRRAPMAGLHRQAALGGVWSRRWNATCAGAHSVVAFVRPADPVEYVAAYLLKNNTVSVPCVCLPLAVRFATQSQVGSRAVSVRGTEQPRLRRAGHIVDCLQCATDMDVLSTLLMHQHSGLPNSR